MTLKHGCAVPTGITITGVFVHKVTKKEEMVAIETMDDNGAFGAGKVLRSKVSFTITGKLLTTYSLPAKGSGAATAASPKIQDVQVDDQNEADSDFTVTAYYYEAAPQSPNY